MRGSSGGRCHWSVRWKVVRVRVTEEEDDIKDVLLKLI